MRPPSWMPELRVAAPVVTARAQFPVMQWKGETSASIVIRAPAELLFAAYADIERMPEWSPMLKSVELVDAEALRSSWALRVPPPLTRLVNVVGFGNLVRWEAMHEVEPPRVLRWRSLSGLQNEGLATFEEGADGCTNVTLTISYTLPNVARPIVSRNWPQRFVRRTMLWTMETFRDALEAEAATMEASADAEAPSESAEAAAIDAAEDLSEAKL